MERLVENWLKKNAEWFKSYAARNMDEKTLDMWLKLNNRKLCECATEKLNPRVVNENCLTPKENKTPQTHSPIANRSLTCELMNTAPKPALNSTFKLNSQNKSYDDILNNKENNKKVSNPKLESEDFFGNQKNLNVYLKCSNGNTGNDSSKNLISLNMVKRNKLIAMRKYHTMSTTKSQSLNKILNDSKIKMPLRVESSETRPANLALKKQDTEFLIEIVKDISCELDLRSLSERIVSHLKLVLNADQVELFFVSRQPNENNNNNSNNNTSGFAVYKYAQSNESQVGSHEKLSQETTGLINQVIETGNLINIPNIKEV